MQKVVLGPVLGLALIGMFAWGCGNDPAAPTDDGDDPGDGETEVIDGFYRVVLPVSMGPGSKRSSQADKATWDPSTEPLSPVFSGYQLEVSNVQWTPGDGKATNGELTGEARLVMVEDHGVSYIVQVKMVEWEGGPPPPGFFEGDFSALIYHEPSESFPWSFTMDPDLDLSFGIEVTWTGEVICCRGPDPVTGSDQVVACDTLGQKWAYLTRGDVNYIAPVISPDGKQIVFETNSMADNPNGRDIYKVAVGDSVLVPVSASEMIDQSPTWSSTGLIAYVSWKAQDGQPDLFVGELNLTAEVDREVGGSSFSHDGQWVIFDSSELNTYGRYLAKMPVGGGVFQDLGVPGLWPKCSPTEDLVAIHYGELEILRIYDLNGNYVESVFVEDPEFDPNGFCWSPDGRRFAMIDFGSGDLYVINRDGTGLRNLSENYHHRLSHPSWAVGRTP